MRDKISNWLELNSFYRPTFNDDLVDWLVDIGLRSFNFYVVREGEMTICLLHSTTHTSALSCNLYPLMCLGVSA